ncbi:LEA type 2 family protein [Paludibacterium yongneupense]|uniref:LEA type 2 family protein n=1 Tax=Paludibacterium yongneupense TaxID=400061 RepID=UPI00055A40A0|nr:LEA type 2 family protein [Paludibacterium yongneupense]
MNRIASVLRIALLGGLLLLAACGVMQLKKPQIGVVDIVPAHSTLLEQNFDVTLRVQNPNSRALSAQGLSFEVHVDGDTLATGVSSQPISVPALSDGLVKIQLHTTLATWFKHLNAILQSGNGEIGYQIVGHLDGLEGLGSVPFKSEGKWKLPAALRGQ